MTATQTTPLQPHHDPRIDLTSEITKANLKTLDKVLTVAYTPYLNHKWKAWTCGILRDNFLFNLHTIGTVVK